MDSKDLERLVEITYEIFKEKNVLDFTRLKFGEEPDNIFKLISNRYYKEDNINNSVNICSWWNCNTYGFSSLVKEKLKNDGTGSDKVIHVVFTHDEWVSAMNYVSGKGQREYFKVDFDAILSKKIQLLGFNCWLWNSYNWFKKRNSRKKNCNFWTGLYYCILGKCGEFEAIIKNEPYYNSDILVTITVRKTICHEKLRKKIQLRGSRRTKLLSQIMMFGSDAARSKVILENREKGELLEFPIKRKIYDDLKYNHVHRDRISNDVFTDAMATKTSFDKKSIQLYPNSSCKGFIQEISMIPFGFLLVSDIQIKIWTHLKETKPIWFFDATGSVHIDIACQKKPFLYSLVGHDPENQSIVPIAEFITTSHTFTNITKYLQSIKNIYFEILSSKSLPLIIVTDFSYVLINSIMSIFNNCNLNVYLMWCYDLLVRKRGHFDFFSHAKFVSYLCATHFLKLVITKSKPVQATVESKKMLAFCFSLLQNSKTLEQFDNYLANVFNIFNQKKNIDSVKFSIEVIRAELITNNLNCESINENKSDNQVDRDKEFEYFLKETKNFLEVDYETNLINSSPFKLYFSNLLNEFKLSIISEEDAQTENNKYYSPQLFQIISNYLSLVPLWTGIIIQFVPYVSTKNITHLTNNPVENWFGNLKNNILKKRKVMASELVSSLYLKLESKFFEIYYAKCDKNLASHLKNSSKLEEIWKDKNERIKRVKSYYYKNTPYFLLEKEDSNLDNQNIFTSLDFLVTFGDDNLLDKKFYNLQKLFEEINSKSDKTEIADLILKEKVKIQEFKSYLDGIKNFTRYTNQPVDTSFKCLIEANELNNFFPVAVPKLGNCFYEGLSILFFGSKDYYFLFKIASVYEILENEVFFANFMESLTYDYTYDELIEETSRDFKWASELNILSLTIFLNRTIYVYNYCPQSLFKYNYKYDLSGIAEKPVPLAYIINHFVPLLHDSENAILPVIETDSYSLYRDIFLDSIKQKI